MQPIINLMPKTLHPANFDITGMCLFVFVSLLPWQPNLQTTDVFNRAIEATIVHRHTHTEHQRDAIRWSHIV